MVFRPDKSGPHRTVFESNKQKILKTQSVCGICGRPVDKSLKYPDPMSACIDHIIPVNKGGHPSDLQNLQLTHLSCNRQKSDKLFREKESQGKTTDTSLPLSINWIRYKARDVKR